MAVSPTAVEVHPALAWAHPLVQEWFTDEVRHTD